MKSERRRVPSVAVFCMKVYHKSTQVHAVSPTRQMACGLFNLPQTCWKSVTTFLVGPFLPRLTLSRSFALIHLNLKTVVGISAEMVFSGTTAPELSHIVPKLQKRYHISPVLRFAVVHYSCFTWAPGECYVIDQVLQT